MFSELHRIDEASNVFKAALNGEGIVEMYDALAGCNESSLEDFRNWIEAGVKKSDPNSKGSVSLLSDDEILFIGGEIRDEMLKDGDRLPFVGQCFVGVVTSFDLDKKSVVVLGQFANDQKVTEVVFEPKPGSLVWCLMKHPSLNTK